MDRRLFGWMPLVAVAVCAGCSPQGRDSFSCTSDSQCDDMEICENETCVAVACKRDGDCATGQRCIDHECVAVGRCRSDDDCTEPTPRCDLDTGTCVACLPAWHDVDTPQDLERLIEELRAQPGHLAQHTVAFLSGRMGFF